MSRTDKIALTAGAIAALLIVLWLLWKRAKAISAPPAAVIPAATSNPQGQGVYAGPTGLPITPQIQYGGQGAFQLNLGTITLPGFHYAGNQEIYMPMFGFVGYSNYAHG